MPNDAKLGLLAGVVSVVVVAAVYFPKPQTLDAAPGRTPAAVTGTAAAVPSVPPAAVGVPAAPPAVPSPVH